MRQKNSADLEATGNTTKQAFEVGQRGGGVGWLREWPYRMQLLSCSESEPQRAKVGFWKVLLHLPLWERRKSKAQGVKRTPSSSVALPVPVLPWQNSLPLGWPTCLRNCSVAIVTWNKIPLWKVFTKCLFCREWSPERQDYMYTMFSKNIYLTVSVAPSNIGICWHWKNNALLECFPCIFICFLFVFSYLCPQAFLFCLFSLCFLLFTLLLISDSCPLLQQWLALFWTMGSSDGKPGIFFYLNCLSSCSPPLSNAIASDVLSESWCPCPSDGNGNIYLSI